MIGDRALDTRIGYQTQTVVCALAHYRLPWDTVARRVEAEAETVVLGEVLGAFRAEMHAALNELIRAHDQPPRLDAAMRRCSDTIAALEERLASRIVHTWSQEGRDGWRTLP